jgi:hypothetical protein
MGIKKKRRARRLRRRTGERDIFTLAGERAYHDALHQHLLDIAHERLGDPEYRALVDDFIEKTYRFLARKSKHGRVTGFATPAGR